MTPSSTPPGGVEARRAALRLLEGDAASMARHIVTFLGDDDWRVRKDAAALAARHLESARLSDLLARAVLQGDDVGLRNAAIEALVTAGSDPSATDEVQRSIHEALTRVEPDAEHTALKFLCAAWVGGGRHGLPRLAEHARDPDPTTASAAVEALARVAGPMAERELEDIAFRDGDPVVRLAALEGLADQKIRLPVSKLAQLARERFFARPALVLLGVSNDPSAIEPLTAALGEPRLVREAAHGLAQLLEVQELNEPVARALASMPDAARLALGRLAEPDGDDEGTARAALTLLLFARDGTALPNLARFGARAMLGRPLMEGLDRMGGAAVRGLLDALPDLDPTSAAWAIEVAVELTGDTRDAELLGYLRAALRTALAQGESVQVAALRGLERFGEAEDASRLVALGARGTATVATAATDAIAALATAAPEAALSALQEEGDEVPLAWSKAVVALPRRLALDKVGEAAAAAQPQVRRAGIEALVHVGGSEAADLAAMALADEDEGVRHAAVRTLAELARSESAPPGEGRASAALGMALRAPEPTLRAAAVRAAAERDLDLDGMALELALDPNPEVEAALFRALARPGTRSFGPQVREQLLGPLTLATTHEDDEVVKAALGALAVSGADAATDALLQALSHPAWDVRLEGARLMSSHFAAGGARLEPVKRALAQRRTIEPNDLVREAIDLALSSLWAAGAES